MADPKAVHSRNPIEAGAEGGTDGNIFQFGGQMAIEFSRRFVALENRPQKPAPALFFGVSGNLDHQRSSHTAASAGLVDVQIRQIHAARCAVGIVAPVVHRISRRHAGAFGNHCRKCWPVAKTVAEKRLGGKSRYPAAVGYAQGARHAGDGFGIFAPGRPDRDVRTAFGIDVGHVALMSPQW